MDVPLQDPAREYRALRDEVDEALRRVAASGRYVLGPEAEALEEEVAALAGTEHAVGVGNGTDALVLSLRALDVGAGDEVIVPAFSFFATAEAVLRAGADPVFADVRPDTLNVDPASAEAVVTDRTAAIVPVHLYGLMADVASLGALCRRHDLAMVEDAAQALGASRRVGGGAETGGSAAEDGASADAARSPGASRRPGGAGGPGPGGAAGSDAGDEADGASGGDRRVRAGSAGAAGCFSFYPTKNAGAMGDAGMVVTDDPAVARRVRSLRDHGRPPEGGHGHREVGLNSRLDELQAAVLRAKLGSLTAWTERRRAHAASYRAVLSGLDDLRPLARPEGARHVHHQFTVRCPRRDALARHLSRRGIGHGVYYPLPLHLQSPLEDAGPGPGSLPEAERAADEVLSLPVFPYLGDEERRRVEEALRAFAA